MSIQEFIRKFRTDIDAVIRGYGISGKINNKQREAFISSDEKLYMQAQRMGVNI